MFIIIHQFSLLMYICRDRFDLILGFGGHSTLPLDVLPGITKLVCLIAVDQVTDLWKAMVKAMGNDVELLDITSLVVLVMGEHHFSLFFYPITIHSRKL